MIKNLFLRNFLITAIFLGGCSTSELKEFSYYQVEYQRCLKEHSQSGAAEYRNLNMLCKNYTRPNKDEYDRYQNERFKVEGGDEESVDINSWPRVR